MKYTMSCKKASLHNVKMFDLRHMDANGEFTDVEFVAEGWFAKVYSATHPQSDEKLALKCIHKDTCKKRDFFKELHYNYYLSPHPNIVNSFDVAFESNTSYIFAQELATEGDLSYRVKKGGLGETKTKKIIQQIGLALDFMHSKQLVHRDVRLENILAFDKDLSRVKLADFGSTQKSNVMVKKENVRAQWAPPEVCQAVFNEGYYVETSLDAWQLGILLFVCLTGSYPWHSADITDRHYKVWLSWQKRKSRNVPRRFKCFSPRLLRLFRRLFDPKPSLRFGVKEVFKYLDDKWLAKDSEYSLDVTLDASSSEIFVPNTKTSTDIVEKVRMIEMLKSYGINTTVDKNERKKRVSEWLMTSVTNTQRKL